MGHPAKSLKESKVEKKQKEIIPIKFGINISNALHIKKISQQQLAAALDIKPPEVSMWINSKRLPSLTDLEEISGITGYPIQWFFKEIE